MKKSILVLALLVSASPAFSEDQKFALQYIRSDKAVADQKKDKNYLNINTSVPGGISQLKNEIIRSKNLCLEGISEFAKDEKDKDPLHYNNVVIPKVTLQVDEVLNPAGFVNNLHSFYLSIGIEGWKTTEFAATLGADKWNQEVPPKQNCYNAAKRVFEYQKNAYLEEKAKTKRVGETLHKAFQNVGNKQSAG